MKVNFLNFSILVQLALAPTIICLFYIYIRDKYEKEPIRLLAVGLLFGIVITVPIIKTENLVTLLAPKGGLILDAFFSSFVVAGLVEELFKFTILYFLVWRNDNFNEKFDGIVYAVFISLGFAGIENVLYVINPELGGFKTAFSRAVFSVPGHALFGVTMGYYFAIARFLEQKHYSFLLKAILVSILVHGTYDFILLSGKAYISIFFIPFVLFLWISGFRKIKTHVQSSPFK